MSGSLTNTIDDSKQKYLVFTSAGDNNNVHKWLEGYREFDVWVCYYGNTVFEHKEQVDFYMNNKGGKFPNLQHIYLHHEKKLKNYQAVFILDDDVIINSADINRLFRIREQYDLWLLQPAFDPRGKISHPITERKAFSFMRYTNFVEMTCPLLRKDKLDEFMEIFEPTLVGYGTDYWYLDSLGPNLEGKVAIVDDVACINPRDSTKGGYREIDLLQKTPIRIKHWKIIQELHNIEIQNHIEFCLIPSSRSMLNIIKGVGFLFIKFSCKCGREIRKSRQLFR